MRITDAQIHLWGLPPVQEPWPGALQLTPASAAEVVDQLDSSGVERAVLVSLASRQGNNELALTAARDFPGRFGVMGLVDLDRPAPQRLDTWLDQPHMLGIRVNVRVTPTWLTDGTADWLWAGAERNGIPLMMFAPGNAAGIGEIARRHPDLRLVVDHLGLSIDIRDWAIGQFVDAVIDLARYPNVGVKLSALPCYVSDPAPFASLRQHVDRALTAFGPQRCFWGSDWSHLPCTYDEWLAFMRDEMPMSPSDREWVMGRALNEWLTWPTANAGTP